VRQKVNLIVCLLTIRLKVQGTAVISNRRLRCGIVIRGQRASDGEHGRESKKNVRTILSGHAFLLFLELGRVLWLDAARHAPIFEPQFRNLIEARCVADWDLSDEIARLRRDRTSAKTQKGAYFLNTRVIDLFLRAVKNYRRELVPQASSVKRLAFSKAPL
jgi:hypothetical protein